MDVFFAQLKHQNVKQQEAYQTTQLLGDYTSDVDCQFSSEFSKHQVTTVTHNVIKTVDCDVAL